MADDMIVSEQYMHSPNATIESSAESRRSALVSVTAELARDYLQLARTAITQGKIGDAMELIEKGQTRLLDRSVVLNRTFDPITDEPIKQLSAAKQALLSGNMDLYEMAD